MTMVATEVSFKTSSKKAKPVKGNLSSAENLFRVGDFEQCAKICKLYFSSKVSFYGLKSDRPEIQFDVQPKSIAEGHLLGALFVQSVFESDNRELESDVSLFERYITSTSPIPFTLARLWLTLKVELKQYKEAKDLLEGYIRTCANLVNDGKRPTKLLKDQYGSLVELLTLRVFPALGMVDASRNLLDVQTNNVLLDEKVKSDLLSALEQKLEKEMRNLEGSSGSQVTKMFNREDVAPKSPASSAAGGVDGHEYKSVVSSASDLNDESDVLSNGSGSGEHSTRNEKPKKRMDTDKKRSTGPIDGVTWEEAGLMVGCTVAVTLVVSQRHRIRDMLSGIGDLLFGP